MQIPGSGGQLFQHVALEPREIATRRTEIGDQFRDGQAQHGIGYVGKRGHEQQLAGVGGVGRAQVAVHDLGHGCAVGSNVVGNGVLQRIVDLRDFRQRLAIVQVDIVGADQVLLVGGARVPQP